MGLGRAVAIFAKIVVLVFLMTLLTLLCFLPLRLLGQLALPRAQALLLLTLGLATIAIAWRFFRLPSRIQKESASHPPVHPADSINFKFHREIYSTLPAPPHLSNLHFSEYIELFDLLRFINLFVVQDPAALAATGFSLRALESAKTILERALAEPDAPAVVAIAKAELLKLAGDFTAAADCYHETLFRFSLSNETQLVLQSRELRLRARTGDFERVRIDCEKFVQKHPSDSCVYMLDSLASLPLMHDFPEFVDEALNYNRQALDLQPQLLSLKVTKGALLYEKRERQEAKRLLQDCLLETSDDYDRAVCHFYLALIERKRGHFPEAKKLAEHVRSFSKEKWLLLRLRQEFAI